jgi:hypothetical protein
MEPVIVDELAETALAIERDFGKRRTPPLTVTVGVDIGQRRDNTAIVVAEVGERGTGKWRVTKKDGDVTQRVPLIEPIYLIRHIERLELGTPYPAVAERVAAVVGQLADRRRVPYVQDLYVVLDATGVGRPVVDVVREELVDLRCRVTAATFTATPRLDGRVGRREISVGKPWMVSRLQALLQTRRIKFPETEEARQLAQELVDFEIKVNEKTANLTAGAFRVGTKDDLVSALGLAVLHEPLPPVTTGPSIWQ